MILNSVLYNKIESNGIIIDLRTSSTYLKGHLDNSRNIPYEDLLVNYEKYLNKNSLYYLYCSRGVKSNYLATKLSSLGYKVYSIYGGYNYVKLMNSL